MIAAFATALALLAAPGVEPDRYALTLSVLDAGIQTVSARTVIVEDGNASVTVQDANGLFEMNASLIPFQGDGDGELALQVSVVDSDGQPHEPQLTLRRGGVARVVIGHEGPDGRMFKGLELTLSPIIATE